eukprot:4213358-Prymnesium_polylepis.1
MALVKLMIVCYPHARRLAYGGSVQLPRTRVAQAGGAVCSRPHAAVALGAWFSASSISALACISSNDGIATCVRLASGVGGTGLAPPNPRTP